MNVDLSTFTVLIDIIALFLFQIEPIELGLSKLTKISVVLSAYINDFCCVSIYVNVHTS